ncbi:hypothetical protein ACF0H5_000518 [Mactra antiquata]
MDLPAPVTEKEIIESINEWPVTTEGEDLYPSSSIDKIHYPTSVSSYFLRNVTQSKQVKMETVPDEDNEVVADIALARWWRKTGQKLVGYSNDIPDSTDPSDLINFASSTMEGIEFMKDEISRLRNKTSSGSRSANISSALSSFYEKLGNLSLAKMHLESAIDIQPEDKEYKWRLLRIKRSIQYRQRQEEALSRLGHNTSSKCGLPTMQQVPRISCHNLSNELFLHTYAAASKPVIITDLVDTMTTVPWSFQHISDIAGDHTCTLKKSVKDSVQWARLEDSKLMKVKDFITGIHGDNLDNDLKQLYLFDWSIPVHCPKLADELIIPKYFAGDFLQRTPDGTLYKNSWPSLFIAPQGITSELHVDAFGSNFWMALFEGKKRWIFFKREDTPLLYPIYGQQWSTDVIFDVNISSPQLKQHPLYTLTQPMECILQPGEVLFVPAGCPHHVENLETSLAISGNFVDLSNFSLVKEELSVNSLIDERSAELYKHLSDNDFKSNMFKDLDHLPWKQYKTWPPTNYEDYDITLDSVEEQKLLNKDS